MKRVRFAPSPTGSLYIGNALSALLAAVVAALDRDETLRRLDAAV